MYSQDYEQEYLLACEQVHQDGFNYFNLPRRLRLNKQIIKYSIANLLLQCDPKRKTNHSYKDIRTSINYLAGRYKYVETIIGVRTEIKNKHKAYVKSYSNIK